MIKKRGKKSIKHLNVTIKKGQGRNDLYLPDNKERQSLRVQ